MSGLLSWKIWLKRRQRSDRGNRAAMLRKVRDMQSFNRFPAGNFALFQALFRHWQCSTSPV